MFLHDYVRYDIYDILSVFFNGQSETHNWRQGFIIAGTPGNRSNLANMASDRHSPRAGGVY